MPFATLGLPQAILKGVKAAGHIEPTPIQHRAIPIIMQGNDLIASAQTGTGKTAAFALPILQKIRPQQAQVQALVLTPTRELALQVAEALGSLKRTTWPAASIRSDRSWARGPLPTMKSPLGTVRSRSPRLRSPSRAHPG